MKRRLLLAAAALACVLGLLVAACGEPEVRPPAAERFERRPGAAALVVVHSRSGHTAEMGRTMARLLDADFVWLEVPEGSGDGFCTTPGREEEVGFQPASIDLSGYRLVCLGTPIWYWHPTAFAYAFLRAHDLEGRRIVLFYTFEGSIASDAVEEWTRRAEARGGRVVDVVGIDRDELGDETMAEATEELVAPRRAMWLGDND